jgi:RimJ/RimL family protein N-acetyltransferase
MGEWIRSHRRSGGAHVADHNVGSRRVLEKCGFVLDHLAQEGDVLEHVLVLTD